LPGTKTGFRYIFGFTFQKQWLIYNLHIHISRRKHISFLESIFLFPKNELKISCLMEAWGTFCLRLLLTLKKKETKKDRTKLKAFHLTIHS
jgi:hypothetical protein